MKTLIFIAFLTVSITVSAQKIKIENGAIEFKSDSLDVKESFKLLTKLTPLSMKWYDLYVIKNNVTYYKSGISKTIYRMDGKNWIKLHM